MANIAQMVNVIQSMVLTEGDQMLLTPTYHVFKMSTVHQDSERVSLDIDTNTLEADGVKYPQVNGSASKQQDGTVNITLTNASRTDEAVLDLHVRGLDYTNVSGEVITSTEMHHHNTFEEPEKVTPTTFTNFKETNDTLHVTLPPMSVVLLTIK